MVFNSSCRPLTSKRGYLSRWKSRW